MLGNKLLCFSIIFASIFLFAACASEIPQPVGIADAISQGLIMSEETAGTVQTREDRHEIVTARSGPLTDSTVIGVGLYFPVQRYMHFVNDTGEFTLLTENGSKVSEGEKLANLWLDDGRMEISRIQAEIRIQQFDQNTANEAARRRTEISNTRFYAEHALNDADLNRLLLHLAQLELSYDRFRFDAANTRDNLTHELEALQDVLAGEYLLAPFDGTVRNAITNRHDIFDRRQPRILSLVDESVFFFSISFGTLRQSSLHQQPVGILGYGNIVRIQSHSTNYRGAPPTLSFDARVVTDLWGAGIRDDFTFLLVPTDMYGLMEALYELNPYDPMQALRDVNLQADITFTVTDYGVYIPHRAIQTQDRLFFTFVYEHGDRVRRFVRPGGRAGNYVHIISGIDAGEQVVVLP